MWYGVALVILNKPFMFNKRISPVCVPEQKLPPDAKRCFVSTYVNSKLDEEGVNLVSGSQCDFGQFPELKNADGVCSIHQHANTDKSFGGPLTCIVNDKAYQFGVYLSQMVVKDMFRKDPVALHYYGHFLKLLSNDSLHGNDFIEIGTKSSARPTDIMEGKHQVNTKMPEKPVDVPRPSHPVQPAAPSSNANGNCYRYSYSTCVTKTNLVVYAGSSNYAWYSRKGIKVSIETTRSYGISGKSGERWNEIALLRLRRSLTTKNKVIPVCLAPREELPPFDALCYVTYYDKEEHRIDEEPVVLTAQRRCPVESSEKKSHSPGLCTLEDPPKQHIQLGAPMVCIVKGRAYQYGVYQRQLALELDTQASQKLGYYAEISIVHSILLGEIASGSEVENVVTIPEANTPKPETELPRPSWPVIQPIREPVVITPQMPGYESVSASSSSQETEPSKAIDFPYQILPSPNKEPEQMLVLPLKPPTNRVSESDSASKSVSKSRSSLDEESVEEIVHQPVQPEVESPILKKNETVIVVKFPAIKYPKFVVRKESKEESVILLPPGSSESKDGDVPATTPVLVSTQSPEPPQAVPSTPAPVKLESHLQSSSHSMSKSSSLSSSASASFEIISPGEKEVTSFPTVQPLQNSTVPPTPSVKPIIRPPSPKPASIPSFPSKPSCQFPGKAGPTSTLPNGITVCPSRPNGEGGSVQTVVLPIPLPVEEYITTSGAVAVHIFDTSGKIPGRPCSGSLIVKRGQMYADEVVTAARCVWPQIAENYNVYVGSLLPRHVTETNFQKTVIPVKSIRTLPLFTGANLVSVGAAVLKLKHKVRVSSGVQFFPLASPTTGPTLKMRCFVSGVCKHGLPVRVQYQLLSPVDCRRRLGFPFLPSLYYCGIGRKDILEFPSGAPLVCDFFGRWTQFGVYDHAPSSAIVDHFGNAEEQSLNEVAIFMRVNGTDAYGSK
ncbi:Trypsin domain containing protein [Trichuris trichiura]|uniref:Trypsin domain containing protein n=1 Tax=Trichuris trichiura TaxID=36087 RepID=A0A077ZDL8_TRITR|nr:Trypsin domain containing protein [Trichuris trichiura]